MTLAVELLRALKAHGAREIFGIPGDFILPFFKHIEGSGILPLVSLSHEPALGFAADAAARMNLGLGVVAVTYGAGALNVAFEPVSGLAYVTNRGAGTVTVVDGDGKVVGNLDGGTFPNHVREDGKGNVFAVNKSRGAEDPKGDRITRITPTRR